MGRAGRPKNGMPPGLQELEDHGVPEGWHGFWHGQQNEIAEGGLQSDLFPGALFPADLGTRAIQSAERLEILSQMRLEEGELPSPADPVLSALWNSEWERVREEPWARNVSSEELRSAWISDVIGKLAEERVRFPGTMKSYGTRIWWDSNEEALERMKQEPSSALAAAIRTEQANHFDLSARLQDLRGGDRELHNRWVEENLLPEIDFLTRSEQGPPRVHEECLSQIWQSLQVYNGAKETSDIEAHHEAIAQVLEAGYPIGSGKAEDFRFAPIPYTSTGGPYSSKKGLYQEAIHNASWPYGDLQDVMNRAAEAVVSQQIARVYLDSEDAEAPSRAKAEEWRAYKEALLDGQKNLPVHPLESLLPLFRGEQNGRDFDDMLQYVDRAILDGDAEGNIFLEDDLYQHFDLKRALQAGSFSREVSRAVQERFA